MFRIPVLANARVTLHLRKLSTERLHPIIPRTLDQIIKKDLFESLDPKDIERVWTGHFSQTEASVSKILYYEKWNKLIDRKTLYDSFIFPVIKGPGQFFVLFGQWKQNDFLLTYLDEFKKDPINAEPYVVISCYDEFINTKNLGLIHTEFLPYITKQEAEKLTDDVLAYYVNDALFPHIHTFNKLPEKFDFNLAFPETKN